MSLLFSLMATGISASVEQGGGSGLTLTKAWDFEDGVLPSEMTASGNNPAALHASTDGSELWDLRVGRSNFNQTSIVEFEVVVPPEGMELRMRRRIVEASGSTGTYTVTVGGVIEETIVVDSGTDTGSAFSDDVVSITGDTDVLKTVEIRYIHQNGAGQSLAAVYHSHIEVWGGGVPSVAAYANAGGTGDRTADITCTTNISLTGTLSNSVDGVTDASNVTDAWYFPNTTPSGGWLKWQFDEPRFIEEVTWKQSNTNTQGTWKWQGSNDDSAWVDLSSNFTLNQTEQVVTLDLATEGEGYEYYRMLHVSGGTAATTWMYETEFKIATAPVPDISGSPNYLNEGGAGDRTSIITTTTSLSLNGNLSNSVDGVTGVNNTTDAWYFPNVTLSSDWLKWEFNEAKHIEEVTWDQNNTNNQGTWKWQGSNNDSDWTDLSSTFDLDQVENVITLDLIGVGVGYTYYRMLSTAGTVAATTWMQEVEFKIMAT